MKMKQHESYYDYVERTSTTLNEMKNRLRDYEAEKKYNSQFDDEEEYYKSCSPLAIRED